MRRGFLVLAILGAAGVAWLLWRRDTGGPRATESGASTEGARPEGPPASLSGSAGAGRPGLLAAAKKERKAKIAFWRRRLGFLPSEFDPSRGPFRGVVLDEEGKPAAGAEIRVLAISAEDREDLGTPAPRTTSAADGRFEFVFGHERKWLYVVAIGPGGAAVSESESLSPADEATIVLRPVRPLRVRLIGYDESPVEGAVVRVRTAWRGAAISADDMHPDAEATARSDASGRAVLPTPGGRAAVLASLDGGPVAGRIVLDVPPGGEDVTLTLPSEGAYAGSVTDPAGNAVGGAVIEVRAMYPDDALPFPGVFEGTTDAQGMYRVDGVPCGRGPKSRDTARVKVSAEGWAHVEREVPAPLPGETRRVDISFYAWRRASGVILLPDGSPCSAGKVFPSERSADSASTAWFPAEGRLAVANSDGTFETDRVPPAARSLVGFLRRGVTDFQGAAPLPDGPTSAVRIQLAEIGAGKRGLRFDVRVLDARRSPVEGATVTAETRDSDPDHVPFRTAGNAVTASDGVAALSGLPEGPLVLTVKRKEAPAFAVTIGAIGASHETTLRVPAGTIDGVVQALDGSPVPLTLQVALAWRTADGLLVPDAWSWRGEDKDGRVRADPDGRFQATGLGEAGEYTFESADENKFVVLGGMRSHRSGETGVRLVAVRSDATQALRPVGLWTDAESGLPVRTLMGIFRFHPAGEPGDAQAVFFFSFRHSEEPGLVRTAEPLAPGVYEGVLSVHGYKPVSISGLRVPDGDHAPRIDLRLSDPLGRIEGTVRAADGKALPEAEVRSLGRASAVRPDGSYLLGVPQEGGLPAEVEVVGDFVRAPAQRVSVKPPAVARADFVVERAGAIRLRLPAGRTPRFRVAVAAIPAGPSGAASTVEFDRASFAAGGSERTLGGLPAGRYRVTIAWDGEAWPEGAAEVHEGQITVIDVRPP